MDRESQADNYYVVYDDDSEPTGDDGNRYEEDSDGDVNHDDENQSTTLGALQNDSQFDIRADYMQHSDTLQEFKAVISKNSTLVNLGEFIKLVTHYDQVHAAAAPVLVELTCCIILLDAVWTSSSSFQHHFWHQALSCSGLSPL